LLVYKREFTLVIDYKKYGGSIMKRLLEITKKVLQLREMIRRVIQKSQIELDRKFEEMKI